MYRLINKYSGKNVALARPQVLLTDGFLGSGDNQKFIGANLDLLAPYIERRDGEPLGVEEVVAPVKVEVSIEEIDVVVKVKEEVIKPNSKRRNKKRKASTGK